MVQFKKLNWKKRNVWVTSDTHAYHKNICLGSTSWERDEAQMLALRPFDNEVLMTEELIRQINKNVGVDDLLLHDGDWSFGGRDKIMKFREQIDCENIFLCYGNHDHNILPYYDHSPHPGFKAMNHVMYLQVENIKLFLSHYPHVVWHQSHKNVIHLHGHTHGSLPEQPGKMMDVGVDVAYRMFGEFRPFNLLEVEEIMNAKEVYTPSHHNSKTN